MKFAELLRLAVDRQASLQVCVGQAPLLIHPGGRLEVTEGGRVSREDLAQWMEQGRSWGLPGPGERAMGAPGLGRFWAIVHRDWGLFRPLPTENPGELEQRNLPGILHDLCQLPQGLVLLGGPRGSGLRTSLACMLEILRQGPPRRILCLGRCTDHVQSHGRGLLVNDEDWSESLIEAWDVLVLRLNDSLSAQQALRAAEEGLLVLGLMRASHAPNMLDRFWGWLPDSWARQRASDSLRGCYAQRLLAGGGGLLPLSEFVTPEVARKLVGVSARVYPQCLEKQKGCWSFQHSLQDWLDQQRLTPEEAETVVSSWS